MHSTMMAVVAAAAIVMETIDVQKSGFSVRSSSLPPPGDEMMVTREDE